MNRIFIALVFVSCLCGADARREQALQGIIQELSLVKQDHLARAEKLGNKALSEQVTKRHDTLVSEWQEALKTGTLAPGSSLAKWRENLQKSLAATQSKQKASPALQDKIDYVAWLLGKTDPRFDNGQKITLY